MQLEKIKINLKLFIFMSGLMDLASSITIVPQLVRTRESADAWS